jgi:RNA polymerase sigma factor (sigma-70 family)
VPFDAPTSDPRPDGFEAWELDLIDEVVRGFLSTRRASLEMAFDDLCQEAATHWWRQRGRFDVRRGASPRTFLRRVVKARLLDIEREFEAEKRGGGLRPLSLDLPAGDSELTLGDLIPADTRRDFLEVRLDSVLPLLTQRQRTIVESLKAGNSKSKAAADAGISRDTLYRELEVITRVFVDEDLEQFLH